MDNPLRQRLNRGEIAKGVAVSLSSPAIAEWLATSWDFIWLDAQHGEWTLQTMAEGVRACTLGGASALVRVPGHEYGVLGPFADQAPHAMMIPMVDTPEQANAVVRALRFPPIGNRSYGGRSPYDRLGPEYYMSEESLLVVAQVESPESVHHAVEIIGTEGLDALFIGAADLRIRMGLPMDASVAETRDLRHAFEQVAKAAHDAGKACGCVVTDDGVLAVARDLGMQILAFGSDTAFIRRGSAAKLAELADLGI